MEIDSSLMSGCKICVNGRDMMPAATREVWALRPVEAR